MFVTLVCVAAMLFIPVPMPHQEDECCDQYTLETAYGFPLRFKEMYSGGIGGGGKEMLRPSNLGIDAAIVGAIVLAATLAVVRYKDRQRTKQ